ncbi:hypothetical protein NZA98_10290, partial [Escherichia coli]|nr:hypothetical protein [Escherichia coli]
TARSPRCPQHHRKDADMKKRYTVVENAGYERECDVHTAESYGAAIKWRDEYYETDEIESLHVEIACELPDGTRTYEF